MARLLITILFAVVFVAVLRIQAKHANPISEKFLRKREVQGGTGQDHLREKRSTVLTSAERNEFLSTHNTYRADTGANNMPNLVWDDVLAEMAQTWSNGCKFAHGNPNTTTSYNYVGQNMYITTGSQPTAATVDESWHNEVNNYDIETNTCTEGKECGHYTQMVWASTTHLGCGMTYCEPIANTNFEKGWLVTCNYGPGGNYVGQKPYTS